MSRLYAWIQRHPKLVDSLPAGFLIFIGLVSVVANGSADVTTPDRVLAGCLVPFVAGPLVFRRRWPIGTFLTAAAAGFLGLFAGKVGFNGADIAFLTYVYTVAAYRPRRFSVPAMVGVYLGAMTQLLLVGAATHPAVTCDGATKAVRDDCLAHRTAAEAVPHFDWVSFTFTLVLIGGLVGLFWVMGDSMRYRREYYVRLEDRAERLERERDAQAQIAAAAERARIARELHDVVAHNVSVMVVQADGATYALDSDPEAARKALMAISQTGRTALVEMRRMLGVLRSTDDAGNYAPQPGIEQLGDLLEQVRAAGLPVTLTVEGVPREMPTGLALAVYRIVQESLTNTRKHGGPNVKAAVSLLYTDDDLVLRIVDNGHGTAAAGDGLGHGLVGMRERVAVFGGSLRAGEHVSGGYAVEAVLPFPESDPHPADVSADGPAAAESEE